MSWAEAAGVGREAAVCSGSEGRPCLAVGIIAGDGCMGAENAAHEMILLTCLRLSAYEPATGIAGIAVAFQASCKACEGINTLQGRCTTSASWPSIRIVLASRP